MLLLHSTPLALKTSVRKSIGSQYLVLQGNRSINIIFYININKCKYYFMIDYRMNTMESFITLSRYSSNFHQVKIYLLHSYLFKQIPIIDRK